MSLFKILVLFQVKTHFCMKKKMFDILKSVLTQITGHNSLAELWDIRVKNNHF
uniref:Uncharacterized protein n=2 Tax=Anguilla anguilla TaxID=7936 RepID=A0A0E9Q4V0_ANGAN